MAKLAEYMTDFDPADIVRRYDYTPVSIEMKIPQMKRGSFKHGAYVMTQMGYSRPNVQCSSYKTPIDNLYLCGASTFPGGMITFGGGYNAAKVVAETLGLNVWWTEPDSVVGRARKGVPAMIVWSQGPGQTAAAARSGGGEPERRPPII